MSAKQTTHRNTRQERYFFKGRNGTASKQGQKVNKIRAQLQSHIQQLADEMRQGRSENLRRYLEYAAQFHHYSFGNILLALSQYPKLSRIAGFKQWNRLGRRVRKGQKGIMILAPITLRKGPKDAEGSKEDEQRPLQIFTLFKPVYVFDETQTEGKPLPKIIQASGEATTLYPALREAIEKSGIQIEQVDIINNDPKIRGASCKGKILLRRDLEAADATRALIHEYAHEALHWASQPTGEIIEETEADATAYIVCKHFNIQTDTADYLLLRHSTPETLLQRLETIRKTAHHIITAIEKRKSQDIPPGGQEPRTNSLSHQKVRIKNSSEVKKPCNKPKPSTQPNKEA